MKKVIDDVASVVDEALDGLEIAFSEYIRRIPNTHVLVRARPKDQGKVGVVSGGGSGHEPAHGGYVGLGMLDAAIAGEVFTSPTPDQILHGIKAADHGAGVLLVVKNYTGDVMNFDIAAEMAEAEGINTAKVVVNDDVAVKDSLYTVGRRGIAGTVLVHKIAGAKAEEGATLEEVRATAQHVIDNARSMGFALTSCTVPANGKPTFDLAEDEMELGIGIHGEPGTKRVKVMPAAEITKALFEATRSELELPPGAPICALVNSMGATPMIELAIMVKHLSALAKEASLTLSKVLVGEYMTSLEMAGASLTLLKLDGELERLLAAPANTPAYRSLIG
jgi:dihydroxyacetone kinase-like protein